MICPNCGTDNKRNFCIKCGALVTENNIYQITTETRNKTTDDLELFIGDNSNAILYKPVNWAAAFTGGFYFVYRKCYFIGILSFIYNDVSPYRIDIYFLCITYKSYLPLVGQTKNQKN